MSFLALLCLTHPLCAHYSRCCELRCWRVLLWPSGGSRSQLICMCLLSDVSPTSLLLQLFCRFSSVPYLFTARLLICLSVFSFALSDDGLWLSVGSVTVTLWSGLERLRRGWAWNSRNRLRNIVLIRLEELGLEEHQCLVLALTCKSV